VKFFALAAVLCAQGLAQTTYRVSLQITPGILQPMFLGHDIQKTGDGLHASLPGGIEARIERLPGVSPGIVVHFASEPPQQVALFPDQESVVYLPRAIAHGFNLPYVVGYRRSERDGTTYESLSWQPAYRAEGKLKLPSCEMQVVVLDLNGDSVFDSKDSRQGTTIGLDINGDGRILGQGEWRKANEIIEVCGRPLQVASLAPDGSEIVFADSDIAPAKVDSPVPAFSITANDGKLIRSGDFRGKVHVLDFWASWCAPCVAMLEDMNGIAQQYGQNLTAIGVNVDEQSRRAAADQLIRDKHLAFQQAVRGLGERDFVWKLFGSMNGIQLSIPLYVVVDRNGIIRYAGNGGDEHLTELRRILTQLLR